MASFLIRSLKAYLGMIVGQVGNLRPIAIGPAIFRFRAKADYQSAAGYQPAPHYRAVRWFSFSSVSTSAENSAFACRCRSPVAELGKPACTLRTNPSRPRINVVGHAFQFTACVSLSFASLGSPPSSTVYSIPYFLINARNLVGFL